MKNDFVLLLGTLNLFRIKTDYFFQGTALKIIPGEALRKASRGKQR
jgi:hypothetical protein